MAGEESKNQLGDLLTDSQEPGRTRIESVLPLSETLERSKGRRTSLDDIDMDITERSPRVLESRRSGRQVDFLRKPSGTVTSPDLGLRQYVTPLLRWWWLILVSVVVGAASGYIGARSTPRVYQSRTTVMVGQTLQNPNPSQSEFYTGQVLAQSYADLVRREPVLRATLEALGLQWPWTTLQAMTSSRVVPGTQLLEISVLDTDPQRVKILADEIAQQLILQSPAATDPQKDSERQFVLNEIEDVKANIQKSRDEMRQLDDVIAKLNSARQIQDARNRQSALQTQIVTWQATYAQLLTNLQRGTPNYLSVVEPAQAGGQPVGPGTAYTVLLGFAIGLVLSSGAAFLLEYIDDTIKTPEDVRQTLGLATLGRIPRLDGDNTERELIVVDHPRSPISGAYRVLRTNLQFCAVDHSLITLMVTSASPAEGKSIIAANLASAMAQSGQQVILVDADLWRPTQFRVFGLDNSIGLTTVLRGDVNLNQALQPVHVENLKVLPSGPIPPNPSDLLGSQRMEAIIEALRQQADLVVFDSPPVMADADAAILSTRVDGVLLVINSGTTRRALAQRSREALNTVGAYLPGVALNRVSGGSTSYYYYDYSKDGHHREKHAKRDSLVTKFKQNLNVIVTKGRPTITPEVAPPTPEQTETKEQ